MREMFGSGLRQRRNQLHKVNPVCILHLIKSENNIFPYCPVGRCRFAAGYSHSPLLYKWVEPLPKLSSSTQGFHCLRRNLSISKERWRHLQVKLCRYKMVKADGLSGTNKQAMPEQGELEACCHERNQL